MSSRSKLLPLLLVAGFAVAAHAQSDSTNADAAVRTRLKSDLRNLVTAQEAYYADHSAYADEIDHLEFRPSAGSEVRLVVTQNAAWAGVAADAATPGKSCVIWINLAEKLRPVTTQEKRTGQEGQPVCDGDPAPGM